MKKYLALLAASALAVFALAACGSDDSSDSSTAASTGSSTEETTAAGDTGSGGGTAETVKIAADPSGKLEFTTTDVSAKAGAATVELVNDSSTPHNLYLDDASGSNVGEVETLSQGNGSFDADLKPGKYTFYCSVPGHREAGMEGTLTVK